VKNNSLWVLFGFGLLYLLLKEEEMPSALPPAPPESPALPPSPPTSGLKRARRWSEKY